MATHDGKKHATYIHKLVADVPNFIRWNLDVITHDTFPSGYRS